MNFALAERLQQIAPFHVMEMIKRAGEMEQAGRSVIYMCIGEPDFAPAQPVLDAAQRALTGGAAMRYTAALGLQHLACLPKDNQDNGGSYLFDDLSQLDIWK